MDTILNMVKGPLAGTLDAVNGILGKFITDPQQKLQATLELTKAQNDLTEKLAAVDTEWVKAQAEIITTEAKSESWLTRNWRPLMMMFFASLLGTVVWSGGYVNGHALDHDFIMEILSTIKLGLSGYAFGRSAEKFVPATAGKIAEIFASKTK